MAVSIAVSVAVCLWAAWLEAAHQGPQLLRLAVELLAGGQQVAD